MYIFQIVILIHAIRSTLLETVTTPHPIFVSIDKVITLHNEVTPNIAQFDDAQHRGLNWYAYETENEDDSNTSKDVSYSSISSSFSKSSSVESSDASSFETREAELAHRVYRTCTPCPRDMLKSYKNIGIKWICGGYQRARRSFKSECMMRYRNCQDGTLFVKLYDHKCKNDTYHGRHFFYHYKT